jgi:hypothetical protein
MSSDRYGVRHFGLGFGWHVVRPSDLLRSVAGPYTSGESAQAKADELNELNETTLEAHRVIAESAARDAGLLEPDDDDAAPASLGESQAALNAALAVALRAFALSHDRSEAEICELRREIVAARTVAEEALREARALLRLVGDLGAGHSVRV